MIHLSSGTVPEDAQGLRASYQGPTSADVAYGAQELVDDTRVWGAGTEGGEAGWNELQEDSPQNGTGNEDAEDLENKFDVVLSAGNDEMESRVQGKGSKRAAGDGEEEKGGEEKETGEESVKMSEKPLSSVIGVEDAVFRSGEEEGIADGHGEDPGVGKQSRDIVIDSASASLTMSGTPSTKVIRFGNGQENVRGNTGMRNVIHTKSFWK